MRGRLGAGLLVAALCCGACTGGRGAVPIRAGAVLDTYIRPKIRQAENQTLIAVNGALLSAAPGLGPYYARHRDHLVWSTGRGPSPAAASLLRLLRGEEEEGLSRGLYHLGAIEEAWSGWHRGGHHRRALVRLAELDLLLTNAFLRRAAQLQGDGVPLAAREWTGTLLVDPGALLDSALAVGAMEPVLGQLRPAHPEYLRLARAWSAYRRLKEAGGWEVLPPGERPRKGKQGAAELVLRRRLSAEGDLDSLAGGAGFDDQVERALRRFQHRHGLADHGRVDGPTAAALEVGVDERLRQLEVNLERWRWLPLGQGARYVLVRLDEFMLDLVEAGQVVLEMKVVAGKA